MMSRLKKIYHLNVDVRKRSFVFAKHTVSESHKDLISNWEKIAMM
jgi:hypothetical protein